MTQPDDNMFVCIHELATGQLEGSLTPEQQRELCEALAADAESRRVYLEHMQDTVSLRWMYSGHYDRQPSEQQSGACQLIHSHLSAPGVRPV